MQPIGPGQSCHLQKEGQIGCLMRSWSPRPVQCQFIASMLKKPRCASHTSREQDCGISSHVPLRHLLSYNNASSALCDFRQRSIGAGAGSAAQAKSGGACLYEKGVDGDCQSCHPSQLKDLQPHKHSEGDHAPAPVQHYPLCILTAFGRRPFSAGRSLC